MILYLVLIWRVVDSERIVKDDLVLAKLGFDWFEKNDGVCLRGMDGDLKNFLRLDVLPVDNFAEGKYDWSLDCAA